jgi:hypothetical protein
MARQHHTHRLTIEVSEFLQRKVIESRLGTKEIAGRLGMTKFDFERKLELKCGTKKMVIDFPLQLASVLHCEVELCELFRRLLGVSDSQRDFCAECGLYNLVCDPRSSEDYPRMVEQFAPDVLEDGRIVFINDFLLRLLIDQEADAYIDAQCRGISGAGRQIMLARMRHEYRNALAVSFIPSRRLAGFCWQLWRRNQLDSWASRLEEHERNGVARILFTNGLPVAKCLRVNQATVFFGDLLVQRIDSHRIWWDCRLTGDAEKMRIARNKLLYLPPVQARLGEGHRGDLPRRILRFAERFEGSKESATFFEAFESDVTRHVA